MSSIKIGDRVIVYGPVDSAEEGYYSYYGKKGTVKGANITCLQVSFDDSDDDRLPTCCYTAQVHRKQCRKLVKGDQGKMNRLLDELDELNVRALEVQLRWAEEMLENAEIMAKVLIRSGGYSYPAEQWLAAFERGPEPE